MLTLLSACFAFVAFSMKSLAEDFAVDSLLFSNYSLRLPVVHYYTCKV